MHYDARPQWRYQWAALVGLALAVTAAAAAGAWGWIYASDRYVRLAMIACAAFAVYLLLLIIYRKYSWRFAIDDENVESRRGLIARRVHSIRIRDLRNVNVRQSVMQRILGVGDVEFSSSAGADIEVVFFGVDDPMAVKKLAQSLQQD